MEVNKIYNEDCKYCTIEDWNGENFELEELVDGKNQEPELYIQDNPEIASMILFLNGVHTEFSVRINYCPICGRQL